MLGTVIVMAGASVAACLVTLTRVIGWKRVVRYGTWIDVLFTVLTFVILAGTLTGALTAVLGGLMMAMFLSVVRMVSKVKLPSIPAAPNLKGMANDPLYNFRDANGELQEFDAAGNWIYNQKPFV